jgi:MFS family permease
VGVVGSYRQLLRNGPLARLLIGEFVSSVGDWLYLVALVVVVYRETQDPVVLGIVGAARLLPYLLLSIPAGIISDRFDRRLVLLVSDLARAACMFVLAFLVATGAPILPVARAGSGSSSPGCCWRRGVPAPP